jgi:hypothetical protein
MAEQIPRQEREWLFMPADANDCPGSPSLPDSPAAAGRLVIYEYCISLLVVTLRRTSGIYRLRPGESGRLKGLPYALLSLLLGWWGIPWGVLYTPLVVLTNLSGGRDVTEVFRNHRTCDPGKM